MSEKQPASNRKTSRDRLNVDTWVAGVLKQRLAYRQYLQLLGEDISDDSFEALRAEIRSLTEDVGPLSMELEELQLLLGFVDGVSQGHAGATKATLHRIGFIKLRMRPEDNHALAHFHIEYKQEHSASYETESLKRLAGRMPKKYERPMIAWARQNRKSLLETWRRLNAGEDIQELVVVKEV